MQLLTVKETTQIIDEVVDLVREAVVSTMGPNGKLAFIKSGVSTKTTKDGVTVARSIKFSDERYEMVNRVITEPAIKTDRECGDGTTTTIQLTAALYEVFKKFPSFMESTKAEKLILAIIKKLQEQAITVDVNDPRLYMMALTSANQDELLAKTVIDIYKESGNRFPECELKEHYGTGDKIERIEGRRLDMTYSNPWFGKNHMGGELKLLNYGVVVIDNRLTALDTGDLYDALDSAIKPRGNAIYPLVLVCRGVEQDVVSQLQKYASANNHLTRDGVPCVIAVSTNMGGSVGTSQMQDLAVMINAPMLSDVMDLSSTEITMDHPTLILGSSYSKVIELDDDDNKRIEEQAKAIERSIAEYSFTERYSLRARFNEKRIRTLRGEMVTIHVGGETNSEVKERIDRYEDVVKAIKSGLVNGVLPGCGVSIIKATLAVIKETEKTELNIALLKAIFKAACSPYVQLMSGIRPFDLDDLFTKAIADEEYSFPIVVNLATGDEGNPEDIGIFDTAYATITALKGGLQTSKILASTQSLILGEKFNAVSVIK